jgi:hypothetical protein
MAIVQAAQAQQVIEMAVVPVPTPNPVMPGAMFSSKPGDRYKSRMWFLSGREKQAIAAGTGLPPTDRSRGMLDAVAREIQADGWRPAGRGAYWYSLRFTR